MIFNQINCLSMVLVNIEFRKLISLNFLSTLGNNTFSCDFVFISSFKLVCFSWKHVSHRAELSVMDLFKSLKYTIFGQRFFRLASFRLDKATSLFYTSNLDIVNSLVYITLISTQIGLVLQRLFSDEQSEGTFYRFNIGESHIHYDKSCNWTTK